MARQHVFPVCKPGSKTFVPLNKKEEGVSITEGNLKYSETEDPSIVFSENINTNNLSIQWCFFNERNNEYIFDLSSPLNTDANIDGNELVGLLWSWQQPINPPNYSKVYGEVNGINPRVISVEPGSVFCLGLKSSIDEMWRDFILGLLYVYYSYGSDKNIGTLQDGGSVGTTGDGLTNAKVYGGQWLTLMWTGTRFVILGSNNWY